MENEKAITTQTNPVAMVKERMDMVNEVYRSIMERDKHFGMLPGTSKDCLYLSGAQKITTMFKLADKVERENEKDLGGGHREVVYEVGLYHRETGEFWGSGAGSCSTMESKYRYRWATVGDAPQEYWDTRTDPRWASYRAVKQHDGKWVLQQRTEHADIADCWNTVRKMAFKRAYVAAVIYATGISDIFTQDIEEDGDRYDDTPPVNHSPAPRQESPSSGSPSSSMRLDFKVIQADINTMLSIEDIRRYCAKLKMTEKQKAVIDTMAQRRAAEITGGVTPTVDAGVDDLFGGE